MTHHANTRRLPSGDTLVEWQDARKGDTFHAFELPDDVAVTASIHGAGLLLGSHDGDDFHAALDTDGAPIKGPVGAAHVAKRYKFLRPEQVIGRCELTVRPA